MRGKETLRGRGPMLACLAATVLGATVACSSPIAGPTPVAARASSGGVAASTGSIGGAHGDCLNGTWTGPITVRVDGTGQGSAAGVFAISAGSGTMQLSIVNGRVASGAWSMGFHASGSLASGQSTSAVSIDADASGSASGPTSDVILAAHWNMNGTAQVDLDGDPMREPINFAGTDDQHLQLKSVDCTHVTASFLPSFDANTDGDASFSGTAIWTGARTLLKAPAGRKTP